LLDRLRKGFAAYLLLLVAAWLVVGVLSAVAGVIR